MTYLMQIVFIVWIQNAYDYKIQNTGTFPLRRQINYSINYTFIAHTEYLVTVRVRSINHGNENLIQNWESYFSCTGHTWVTNWVADWWSCWSYIIFAQDTQQQSATSLSVVRWGLVFNKPNAGGLLLMPRSNSMCAVYTEWGGNKREPCK